MNGLTGWTSGKLRAGLTGVLVAASLAATACSGVPHSSRPEVVRPVDENANAVARGPAITPTPGDDPRAIVNGFLQAAVSSDSGHSEARQFLTTDAKRKWQDTSTTVADDYGISIADARGNSATVTVSWNRIGQLDNRGVFTPTLKDDGTSDKQNFTFELIRSDGEWRIDSPPQGLLIKRSDFLSSYRARSLYFFDTSESQLVPDLRYSQLDGQALSSWLLGQLVAGPRDELATSVVNELTDPVDVRRAAVTFGERIQLEMPGSTQIDSVGRLRLAEELAWTFGSIRFGTTMRITDNGVPIDLPNVGTEFSTANFQSVGPQDNGNPSGAFYYVLHGALIDGLTNRPVPSRLGLPTADLKSVAVLPQGSSDARIAAVSNTGAFLIGTLQGGLKQLAVPGVILSRPEFNINTADAWVITSHGAYRISHDLAIHPVNLASSRGGLPRGDHAAVRFSPDGARIALAFSSSQGNNLWIGSVVVSGSDTRIDNVEQITPDLLDVADVTWSNATTMLMIAQDRTVPNSRRKVWSVQSDGSLLVEQSVEGLPGDPDTITSGPGQFALVAVGQTIWIQRSSTWAALSGSGQTPGASPVYAP